ncbi:MAG: SusC/RagA family TonB-linked outer membrane protein, partial [Tannerellaceae bacterium]|nr:SusC/RagA family TonB-linked outer membrane protein [Tannerellaceae bacterium]
CDTINMSTQNGSFLRREYLLYVFLLAGCFSGFAQEFSIEGNVKNSTGEPLVGVAVTSDQSGGIVLTDLDGNFWIDVREGEVIQFSYIGFVTQRVRIRNASPLYIILQDENEYAGNLYEIGYGQRRKKDVTSAISEVRPDEESYGWVSSAQDLLLGKIPGLTVTSDGGAPGTGVVMRIRGGASLYANSEPLVVVDGFPLDHYGISGLENWLSMINPNDIESFTILRDAGATAIYGGRGANGVIQITTKKGNKGEKPTASYHGNMSISTVRSKLDVMDADTYRRTLYSMYGGDHISQSLLGSANTNWQDEIYQTAFSTDHHVSVVGGLDFMPYRVALGYTGQEGVLETSKFQRFTAAVNLAPTFFDDHLTFNIQARYMRATTKYADQQAIKSALYMDPTQPVYNGSSYWQWGIDGAPVNPVSLLYDTDEQGDTHSFTGMLGIDYRFHFAPSLSFHANIGIDRGIGDVRFDSVSPLYTAGEYASALDTHSRKTHQLLNTYLQWNYTYKRNRLNMMAGYEWQRMKNLVRTADRTGSRGFRYQESDIYDVAFMGRIHYTHRNKYLVSLDVRTGPQAGSNWIDNTYAAAGVGWKIHEEVFLRNSDKVTELKLRASYGIVGQKDGNPVTSYPLSERVSSMASYPVGDQSYSLLPPDFQPNYVSYQSYSDYLQDIRPEYTHTLNGGIDFGFFRNRLRGSVDYYLTKGFDLWGPLKSPTWEDRYTWNWYYSSRYYRRDASWSWDRMGFDVSLDMRPVEIPDFTWDLGVNFSCIWDDYASGDYYWNKGLAGAISIGEGEYIMGGYFTDSNSFYFSRYSETQATPKLLFGLNTTFRYKQFDLSTQWRYHNQPYVYNEVLADQVYTDSFLGEGYLINRTQAALTSSHYGNHYLSGYFIENASFTRCDYITFGYTLPETGSVLSGGRVYATVQNPFLITEAYQGADPEVGYITDANTGHRSPGIDPGTLYPRPVSVVIGVTLNF